MTDKCDDASATLDLPDLNFLISATARQIVFHCALRRILLSRDDFAHIFDFFLGLFYLSDRGPALILTLAPIFQLRLHLLNAFFRRQPREGRCPRLVLTWITCASRCC